MSENIKYSFRTSMGGFHKGDVATYIAQSAAIHQKKVSELESQLLSLREENADLREQLLALQEQAELTVPSAPAEEVPAEEPLEALELAAYRRAEAAERLAHERAGKLYEEMNALCQASAGRMLQAEAVTAENLSAMERQFDAIRSAMDALRAQLAESHETLTAMACTVPDPAEGLEEI